MPSTPTSIPAGESDGRKVLFYSSTARDGQKGEIRLLDRATGREDAGCGTFTPKTRTASPASNGFERPPRRLPR